MFWAYILHSEPFDKYYIGFTHDLEKRQIAHNHSKNKGYTRRYQPWELVYSKIFDDKHDAMEFEKYLKTLKNKEALKEIIRKK
jgi:putative endonuclease